MGWRKSVDEEALIELNEEKSAALKWETPSTGTALAAGAMAGLFYVLASHPLDILSMRMQCDIPTIITKGY